MRKKVKPHLRLHFNGRLWWVERGAESTTAWYASRWAIYDAQAGLLFDRGDLNHD